MKDTYLLKFYYKYLPGEHWEKGSPVNPTGQVQIGLWFLVVHNALNPQVFGHGSAHFLFKQAKWGGHSALTTQVGLQFGGIPLYSGRHVQTAWPFTSRHLLLGPHGDGKHGSDGGTPKNENKWIKYLFNILSNKRLSISILGKFNGNFHLKGIKHTLYCTKCEINDK